MKLVMKILWLFLMKKRNTKNWKKALEWWIAKEAMLKKLVWLKKVKKLVIVKLLSVMKLFITVWNNTSKYKNEIILFYCQV